MDTTLRQSEQKDQQQESVISDRGLHQQEGFNCELSPLSPPSSLSRTVNPTSNIYV